MPSALLLLGFPPFLDRYVQADAEGERERADDNENVDQIDLVLDTAQNARRVELVYIHLFYVL